MRDPRLNLINVDSKWANGQKLVVPNDPDRSLLLTVMTRSDAELEAQGILSRAMPLKFDKLNQVELDTIRNWIATGAN